MLRLDGVCAGWWWCPPESDLLEWLELRRWAAWNCLSQASWGVCIMYETGEKS